MFLRWNEIMFRQEIAPPGALFNLDTELMAFSAKD